MNNFQSPPFDFTTNLGYNTNMNSITTYSIVRYTFTFLFACMASFVTWVAVTDSIQGKFQFAMIPSVMIIWVAPLICHVCMKDLEATL